MTSWGDTEIAERPTRADVRDTPPHSVEAEQSVLGALMLDNAALHVISDLVDVQSFYRHEHAAIFVAIELMVKAGQPADPITVFEHLQARDMDEDADLAYLNSLQASVPSARNVRRYAEIVAGHYADRALLAASDEAARIAADHLMPLAQRMERIASAMAKVERLSKGVGGRVPLLRLDALRAAHEQVRWTVKHVLPASSLGMMFGGSGTFKSFIALDAALHVAHGLPWMGRITTQAPVLYVAAEGGAGLWSRIHAWHKTRGLKWGDLPFYVVPAAVDLTADAWRVVDAAQAVGVCPGLVIVDTLSQTYSGEENSANEMAAYFRELGLRFRELWGCSVLLVHHSGHASTERPRGSSAIRANVDYLLGVFRDEKELLATVTCAKQKDGEIFDDATFHMSVVELGVDDDGDKLTSLVARHLSSAEEVERARLAEQAAGRGGRNSSFMALVSNGMEINALRKSFYELLEGLDAEAKKKAFFRARQWAVDQGYIDVAQGIVIDLRAGA